MYSCGIVTILAYLASFTLSVQAKTNCDALGVNFYDFIGCKKQNTDGDCPSYSDCKYERPPGKCLFNGHVLSDSDRAGEKADVLCNFGCFCSARDNNTKGTFVCAQGQCGRWRADEGCYLEYDLVGCCGRQKCDRSDVTCEVDGETYKEGQKFYPKNECSVCICAKDFNGKYEGPNCKRRPCDAEIRHAQKIEDNCAPVYYTTKGDEALCCPQTFICPSSEDKITTSPTSKPKLTCKYGDKTYESDTTITRTFEQYGKKRGITCKCELPPFFTCTAET